MPGNVELESQTHTENSGILYFVFLLEVTTLSRSVTQDCYLMTNTQLYFCLVRGPGENKTISSDILWLDRC